MLQGLDISRGRFECDGSRDAMISYLVRRLLQAVVVLLGVLLLVTIMFAFEPATTLARAIVGPRASAAQMHAVIVQNGFNQPIWVQYWKLLSQYAQGNFGHSYQLNAPVGTLIAEYLPKTLLLVGISTVLALIIAIPLGMFQVVRRNKPSDYALTGVVVLLLRRCRSSCSARC